jgi:DNA-binding NtrC family response regulator
MTTFDSHQVSASSSRKTVLIVDSDPACLEAVSTWLTEAGYFVVALADFAGSKRHLASADVDVLVTDVRLGLFNGLQLVILGKMKHPDMTAVVLTRFDDPVLRREAMAASAAFLLKPITASQLLNAIDPEDVRTRAG